MTLKNNFKIPKVLLKLILYKDPKMHSKKVCNHYKIMKKFYTEEKINEYLENGNLKVSLYHPESLYDDNIIRRNIKKYS